MRLALLLLATLVVAACSKDTASPDGAASASASAPATAPAGFDVEGFCEQAMALAPGRDCQGDDEIIEGNKVGLCRTTLIDGRDDGSLRFDETHAAACLAAVKGALPSLPDRRTLSDIRRRFEDCQRAILGLKDNAGAKPLGLDAGAGCHDGDCRHGLYCAEGQPRSCVDKKKAGASCASSRECLGRCSRKDGNQCLSYCGSG